VTRDDDLFPLPAGGAPADTAAAARAVLLLELDPPMAALIAEWLQREGLRVLQGAAAVRQRGEVGLIVLELAFPRQGGGERLQRLREAWPGVPVIVLSPTLLPGVQPQGEAARRLGAAALLPAPASRSALLAAVARVLAA
jgi:DNA-binding response OmpR family regulator